MIVDLFWRFLLISVLAFGGGAAALPLVERLAVSETGWVNAQDFATAVACDDRSDLSRQCPCAGNPLKRAL
jgi:chromate transport protein ChrA